MASYFVQTQRKIYHYPTEEEQFEFAVIVDEITADSRGQARAEFTREHSLDFTEPLFIRKIHGRECKVCGTRYSFISGESGCCPGCGQGGDPEKRNLEILRSFLQMLDAVNQEYDLPDTFEDAYMVGVSLKPEEWGETLAARIELTAALDAIHAYLNREDLSQL